MTDIDIISRREDVLDELTRGPLHKRDLVECLDSSRSTVDRAIRELEETPLVERRDGGYVATFAGRLALECYREYRRKTKQIFDAEAALAPLPRDCDLPLEFVGGAEIRVATDPAPYRLLERVLGTVRDADEIRTLLPVLYDSRFIECCYEHTVGEQRPAELVVDEPVVETVREDFSNQLEETATCDWFTLRTGPTPSYGLLLTTHGCKMSATVLVFGESLGPVHAVLQTDDPGAVQWAEERFERAVDASVDVTRDASGREVANATGPETSAGQTSDYGNGLSAVPDEVDERRATLDATLSQLRDVDAPETALTVLQRHIEAELELGNEERARELCRRAESWIRDYGMEEPEQFESFRVELG